MHNAAASEPMKSSPPDLCTSCAAASTSTQLTSSAAGGWKRINEWKKLVGYIRLGTDKDYFVERLTD
jgi:hypothetical protein